MKSSILSSIAAIVVLAGGPSRAAEPEGKFLVQIYLDNGQRAVGKLALTTITIERDSKRGEMSAKRIRHILFGKGTDKIVTPAETIDARVIAEKYTLETDQGILTIERARMRSLWFTEFVPIEAIADEVPTPAATIPLAASIRSMVLSHDRKWLYVLNGTARKLERIDMAKRALDEKAIDLGDASDALTLAPDGKTLYAYGEAAIKPARTKIVTIDPAEFRNRTSCTFDDKIFGMAANDRGQLFLSIQVPPRAGQIVVFDVAKETVLERWPAPYQPYRPRLVAGQTHLLLTYQDNWPLHLAPLSARYTPSGVGAVFVKITATTGKTFNGQLAAENIRIKTDAGVRSVPTAKIRTLTFAGDKDTLVSDAETLVGRVEDTEFKLQLSVGVLEFARDRLQKLEPGAPLFRSLSDAGIPGGRAMVSVDGKYALVTGGGLVMLGEKPTSEKLPPHRAGSVDGEFLAVALPNDLLKIYKMPSLESVMTLPGVKAVALAHDSQTLVAAIPSGAAKPAPRFPGLVDPNGPCDLQLFDMKKLITAKHTRK